MRDPEACVNACVNPAECPWQLARDQGLRAPIERLLRADGTVILRGRFCTTHRERESLMVAVQKWTLEERAKQSAGDPALRIVDRRWV